MKKTLAILIVVVVTLALAGCTNCGNEPAGIPTEATIYAVESIAGVWDWPSGGGNPIFVNTDGTWNHTLGDTDIRGKVELAQDSGNYAVEFVALEWFGAGAIYDSYGNLTGKGFDPETNEYIWVCVPEEHNPWFFGTYSIDYDRLIILSPWNDTEFEMERSG